MHDCNDQKEIPFPPRCSKPCPWLIFIRNHHSFIWGRKDSPLLKKPWVHSLTVPCTSQRLHGGKARKRDQKFWVFPSCSIHLISVPEFGMFIIALFLWHPFSSKHLPVDMQKHNAQNHMPEMQKTQCSCTLLLRPSKVCLFPLPLSLFSIDGA